MQGSDITKKIPIDQSNVFSIPPGCDFLREFVHAFMNGQLVAGYEPANDPLTLVDATIYVPNRRTARALSLAFLAALDGRATLLPVIRTLGDVDDDEFGLDVDPSGYDYTLKPVSELDRKLELANLIRFWKDQIADETRRLYGDEDIVIPTNPADSIRLAGDLANLLKQITQEEADWHEIRKVVPEEHAEWWRLTTTFLQIVMENWPNHLRERGQIDPDALAVMQLKKRVAQIESEGSKGPVIAAGSTGSVPSTQALLKTIAGLEKGAVILPGVDMDTGEDEWQRLSSSRLTDDPLIETHPQFGLARTLNALGVERKNIRILGRTEDEVSTRNHLVSRALALSDFTADWVNETSSISQEKMNAGLERISLIEAGNERQEALAIAIALRETLETEGKTAALVTPDRNLARRVAGELERFNIHIDDSAGISLSTSPVARVFLLLASVCFDQLSNPLLVSLLKSQFCLAGMAPKKAMQLAHRFERAGIRGVIEQARPGFLHEHLERRRSQLAIAKHIPAYIKAFTPHDWEELLSWAALLDGHFEDLIELSQADREVSLKEVVEPLRQCAIQLSLDASGVSGFAEILGAREFELFLEKLLNEAHQHFTFLPSQFPAILDALLEGMTYRTSASSHPRLHILGPLEARLLEYDRVCLAGLNENTWPQGHRGDPFLNRAIRRELGIPSPERRTGLAAHDFQQLIAKKEVVLSRSSRVDKAPTVASRWLQRLLALGGKDASDKLVFRGSRYLELAREVDRTTLSGKRANRPSPTPPVSSRPEILPVTDIETWIRDPYALYAKRILKLSPLDPLERDPDPLLKGTLYHAIMEDYIKGDGDTLPAEERLSLLAQLVREKLREQNLPLEIEHVWIARFDEIAGAYVEWEILDQAQTPHVETLPEVKGKIPIGETFTLTARADRIDTAPDGTIRILDYKTGGNPSAKQARNLSPQLALEGHIASKGGFVETGSQNVNDLMFVRLRQGKGFKVESIKTKDGSETIIHNAAEQLEKMILAYQQEEQGYLSRHAPFKDSEMSGDYDHLARTREWSFGEEDGEE